MKGIIRIIAAGLLFACAGLGLQAQDTHFNGDGPYITYLPDGKARVVTVDAGGRISDTVTEAPKPGDVFTVTDHTGTTSFDVTIRPVSRPEWKHEASGRILVMSDPHGRMDCLVEMLRNWGVVDEKLDWSFGTDQLIIIGDVFDRGEDVTQIFWLLYKLEAEAEAAGGRMTFVLGNHEPMVLSGDYRYAKPKYCALADSLGTTYRALMGPETELGRWLGTRNTMTVIGDNLFVHAGIGRDLLDKDLDIPEINDRVSSALFQTKEERKADPLTYFLVRSYGPIWYRGLVHNKKKYKPADRQTVLDALDRYDVSRIYVGHTIFRNVKKFYGGLVTDVNVDNAANQAAGRSRGLLIEGSTRYVVDAERKVRKI